MRGFKGERVLMRIHINEQDRDPVSGKRLSEAIVALLHARGYAGATELRAVMGFGARARLHTDRLEFMSFDMPVVIECVETAERIADILPTLDTMIGGGLVTLERAKVILYRPHVGEGEKHDWPIDITGSWERIDPDAR
jgi:PII-like signaling protein